MAFGDRRTPLKAKKGFKRKTVEEVRAKQATRRATIAKVKSKPKKRSAPRKPTMKSLKTKLWAECKRIIRERHGNTCYTCGATGLEGSNWQTGHFISSSICSVEMRYSLDNLRPQCMACNIHKSGNWVAYEKHLKQDGVDVEELKQRNEATKNQQYDSLYYLNKIEEYKQL